MLANFGLRRCPRTNGRTDESDERLGQCCESAQKTRFRRQAPSCSELPAKPCTPTTSDNMYSVKWDLVVGIGGAVSRRALDPVLRLIACCWPQKLRQTARARAHTHSQTVRLNRRVSSSRPARGAVGFGVLALVRLTLLRHARRHRGNDVQLGSVVDRIPTVRP